MSRQPLGERKNCRLVHIPGIVGPDHRHGRDSGQRLLRMRPRTVSPRCPRALDMHMVVCEGRDASNRNTQPASVVNSAAPNPIVMPKSVVTQYSHPKRANRLFPRVDACF